MDDVRIDGRHVGAAQKHVYLLLNKPTGYTTTVRDKHAEHTVMELLRGVQARVYPVGRLDVDTAGLLLFSNDGDFTQLMTHPSHCIGRTYRVIARGEVTSFAATDLRRGVALEDGLTAPADVEFVDFDAKRNITTLDITIHEGRNRQVRRMLEAVGHPVFALTRIAIGPIKLEGLAPGTWRHLRATELEALREGTPTPEMGPAWTPESDIQN